MKVVFVIGGIVGGGIERRTVNLVNELSNRNELEVCLLTAKEEENEYKLLSKVKRYKYLKLNLLNDVFILNKFVESKEIDVVIGMGIYPNFVVSLNRFINNVKTILVEANDPKHDRLSTKSRVLRKLIYWRADGYIFQTKEEKMFFSKYIQSKSVIIHNPVIADLPYRSEVRMNEVVAFGRLEPQKNYIMMIKAFSIVHNKHPEYKLKIYGKGSQYEALIHLINQMHLKETVEINGFCLDVHEKVKNSDIFAMSSDFEGMPNSLLEAMSMGFPVICTACGGGGTKELIIDSYNGVLTPVGDEKAFAKKIIWMIENFEVKEQMAKNAIEIRESHSLSKIADKWVLFIIKVLHDENQR